MKKNKNTSLKSMLLGSHIYLFGLLFAMIVSLTMYIVGIYAFEGTTSLVIRIIFATIFIHAVAGLFIAFIYFNRRSYRLFYHGVYENGIKNLEVIRDGKAEPVRIEDESVDEFKKMNELFEEINEQLRGKTITSREGDYSSIPLQYLDEENRVVTYESLTNNIVNLIIATKSFRNALLDISYGLLGDTIKEEDAKRIVNEIRKGLEYPNILIAMNKRRNGFIVYVPVFDSISQLEEELSSMFRHISLARRTSEGRQVAPAKVAVVIYPYSEPSHILDDLGIAKRSNKPINIYLPSKENRKNDSLLYESMNVNTLAKISERLDLLGMGEMNDKEVNRAINDIAKYFSFSISGYVKYNEVKRQFICEHTYSPEDKYLVREDKILSKKFVDKLVELKDADQSYYFSNRKHLNDSLGLFIDSHEIKSGLFYVVMKANQAVAVIYFLNDDKELEFDTTIKQGLINISNKIGSYIKSLDEQHISEINARRFQEILKINNDILYSINPDDYSLFFLSPALQSLCPKARVGEPCYQALYGLDAPCKNCPLKTKKHMVEILKKRKFETSVVLHNANDKAEHLYLNPMERSKVTSDLFSQDFLVNSYYSFCVMLEEELELKQEGEVLFLNIDNVAQLIKSFGNDGYIKLIRNFFDLMNDEMDVSYPIYVYKNDNFALLLPTCQREEVVKYVEHLYLLSKDIKLGSKEVSLNISYYDFKYPAGKTGMRDWINYAEKVMTGLRRGKNTDILYFNEDKYTRSASRDAFMLNNVLEAFNRKKYYMEYQPIVGNKDRTIHNVELLLRLTDPFTGEPMNIGEAINIVTKNGRIDLVSNAMQDCLDKLFEVSDLPFFKSMGLDHMAINIEYTTLADKSFVESFNALTKKHNIPKDFLCFEVQERDLQEHYAGYKQMTFNFVTLVCDQYRGELMRLDELKNLGVKEVKISRDVILNVINDDLALDRALRVWKEANELNMPVTFVGVERRQQADLLHDDVLDSYFQGRFFYSPLSEEKFFKTLRENSIKEIADLDV